MNNSISWNEYFMSICKVSALRSKDPSTKVGSCIVDDNSKRIVGIGYNGFPNNCSDELLPWGNDETVDINDTKYPYVIHAEANAIINMNIVYDKSNLILYTTLFPCNECAKLIIQSNIKKVIYLSDKNKNKPYYISSVKLLNLAKIPFINYKLLMENKKVILNV
jgi:dCMP deaminase